MPGIGERDRLAAFGHAISRQELHALRRGQFLGIEPQLRCQIFIQPNEAGRRDRRGGQPRIEMLRQAGIAVVEAEQIESSAWACDGAGSLLPRAPGCKACPPRATSFVWYNGAN